MTATAEHPDDERPACHVVPLNDWREHTASCTCWCNPQEDAECEGLWLHNAMDQRELYERGELRPQ